MLGSISESSRKLGELDAAREATSEAISLRERHGDESLYAFALVVLAGIATQGGDHDEAATLVKESFPIAIERDDLESIPPNLFIAARIAAAFGDHERAALFSEQPSAHFAGSVTGATRWSARSTSTPSRQMPRRSLAPSEPPSSVRTASCSSPPPQRSSSPLSLGP